MGKLESDEEFALKLPPEVRKEYLEEVQKYASKVDEYRGYDSDFLYRELEAARKMSEAESGSGARQRFAALEVLRERSKEKRQSEVFTKRQANVIMWSTVVIAFFTMYPTLKSWVSNIDRVGCLFEQNVIAKEPIATEAIH